MLMMVLLIGNDIVVGVEVGGVGVGVVSVVVDDADHVVVDDGGDVVVVVGVVVDIDECVTAVAMCIVVVGKSVGVVGYIVVGCCGGCACVGGYVDCVVVVVVGVFVMLVLLSDVI